ncbi:unnamed protein product [Angiostrongylus costaricensis]|uniref:Transposase n=1 Tax=Angiostrongylus costaricensis TaxID=334426 RepID=A0A158PDW3_ANGCS|nr:unnamed protein product [Angiostrongylus costaricensis]
MFPSGDHFNNIRRRNGVRDEAMLIRVVLDLFARLYTDYVACLRNFQSQHNELIRNGNSIPPDVHERQLKAGRQTLLSTKTGGFLTDYGRQGLGQSKRRER